MFKSIIQSTKNFIPKVKQWLGFRCPKREKGQKRWAHFIQYYKENYANYKFFGLVVMIKTLFIIGSAWWLGYGLIPWLDDVGRWAGIVARTVLLLVFSWFFFAIIREGFLYKPIRRDRRMFGHSKRDRSGWGMLMYMIFTILIVICYIFAVGLIVLQANVNDQVYSEHSSTLEIFWGVVSQFADPGNLPQAVGWGRIVALLSALSCIVCLSGFLITSLVSIINRRTRNWQQGLIRYERDFKDYVVIIGLNEQTATIVQKSLCREDVEYVLVQTSRNVEEQRARLELKLNHAEEERVVFYFGDRTIYEDICDLRLENAREVYILGENVDCESEPDHDSKSMKSLELISQYCEELSNSEVAVENSWWGNKLKCHVELEYQSTYTIFKATHIYKLLNQNLEFVPFNVYDIWAKKVLVDNYAILPGKKSGEHVVQRYQPIDSYREPKTHEIKGITPDSEKSVHLFIAGMNQMGISLAMQAALMVHLPNYHTHGIRTTITFISEHATRESEFLMGHYEALFALCRHRTIVCDGTDIKRMTEDDKVIDPLADEKSGYYHLGENFMDIQWEFIEGSMASPCVRDYLIREVEDKHQTCTIAVCNNDPQKSIATALYLPERVQKRVQQVLVYQRNSFDLVNKVATGEKQWKRYEKLKPFGMIADCYKGNMFDAVMPKLVLALYKSHKDIKKRSVRAFTNLNAYSSYINRLWDEEGIVDRMSNIDVVESFRSKLRSAGLTEFSSGAEINKVIGDESLISALVAAEHQRWVTERLTMGFRPLNADEMAFFEQLVKENPGKPLPAEGKAKKEHYKNKSRAHLDICSTSKLDEIDPGVCDNDRLIVLNTLRGTFFTVESQIISHLALSDVADGVKSEGLRLACNVLQEMEGIKGRNLKKNDGKDVISIPSMWVGKYPVTQELWKRVMGSDNNPSVGNGVVSDDHPVFNVSKEDVEDFILVLNDMTGLRFSLPTRDEWLSAALGGISNVKLYSRNNILKESGGMINVQPSIKTMPVNKVHTNAHKLCGMLGNVWEWTRSIHSASTYCFCGGSWRYTEKECDLSDLSEPWSSYGVPEHKSDDLGFRLVLYHAFDKPVGEQVLFDEDLKMIKNIADHMISVPEGDFVMGSHAGHHVKMSAFMISAIPVKQRQYEAIMGKNPSEQKGIDLPVENVSYRDAIKFIKKLNESCSDLLQGIGVQVDGPIFALPTEAQWEYAARGGSGDTSTYTDYSGSNNPDLVAWHFGITKSTHVVGAKNPNALGLCDMCGNVWEWCFDRYQSVFSQQCKDEQVDPTGPKEGITHVLKGGSWRFTAEECRITGGCHWHEDYKASDVGFRLVANVSKEVIDKLKEAVNAKGTKSEKDKSEGTGAAS